MVADQPVVRLALRSAWAEVLPGLPALGERLLERWSAPQRHYHGLQHLVDCLQALDLLGSTERAEALAIWFHDAVHTNSPGADERASAAFAATELSAAGLPPAEIAEVARLVLTTLDHDPAPSDGAGARVCDADLAILGASPVRYRVSVAALRAEFVELDEEAWRSARLARIADLRKVPHLFHTAEGRAIWGRQAEANLTEEYLALNHGRSPR